MDLLSTISGSLMEGFFPAGWDLKKIDACASVSPEKVAERQPWWHPRFEPVVCETVADFDVMMGHEIAMTICEAREAGRNQILILPVGPMGMYRWAVYFLREWDVTCDHVTVGLQALRRRPGVRTATVFGQSMHLLVDKGVSEEFLRAELAKVGIPQADIRPIAPSLEDVFVALTTQRNREKP